MKKNTIIRLLLLLCFFITTHSAHSQQKLFTVLQDTTISIPPESDTAIGASILVNINISLLDTTEILKVMLPGNDSLILLRKRRETDANGRFAWYGMIRNQPGSFALFTAVNNVVTGRIVSNRNKQYRLSYLKNNVNLFTEINAAGLQTYRHDMAAPSFKTYIPNTEDGCPDSPLEIDVMVVYTQAALDDASTGTGDDDLFAIESLIYQNICLSNLSYERSNVIHRLRLVHMEKVIYAETTDQHYDVILADLQQGAIPNVHALRDLYKADVVVLLVELAGKVPNPPNPPVTASGYSFIRSEHSPEADYAYCIVRRSYAANEFTFPHEVGHVMGARHERTADGTDNSPFAFNHGYVAYDDDPNEDYTWKTIMSVSTGQPGFGFFPRKLYWSNPNLTIPDFFPLFNSPMGTPGEDNAQALNISAPIVARFRCGSPKVSTVWMKDTYDDTGGEPDPNTVGQRMCRSPYIWIRNAQDICAPDSGICPCSLKTCVCLPGQLCDCYPYIACNPCQPLFCQHQHQNPIFNQDNWIYVKLHNGGPEITGRLQLYITHTSPSLIWPDSWDLLKNVPLTIDPSSTKIVETEWKKEEIPGTGHYCMLARWVSDSDPIGPDIANVGEYTRQNNNVIWRNLNIVQLVELEETTVTMMVRNTTNSPLALEFDDPAKFPNIPFTETGTVYIIPDPVLYKAWKKGKSKPAGLIYENGKFRVTNSHASLNNIKLPKKKNTTLTIVFAKRKETIGDQYLFTVTQFSTKDHNKKYVGEVGYEIYSYQTIKNGKQK